MRADQPRGRTIWQVDAAGACAVAVLTAIAYFIILAPIARNRTALAAVRSELTQTRKKASDMRGVEATINAELARVREEIETSPVRLEASDRLNRRLARLMALATEAGLVIHGTRAGDIVAGARFDLVPIEVSGSGAYSSCGRFLNRLYTNLTDVEVLGFDISGQPASPAAPVTFRFDLSWYAAPSVAAAPQEPGE